MQIDAPPAFHSGARVQRPRVPQRVRPQVWRCEAVEVGGPLDAAIARTHGWCRRWWSRFEGAEPWLAAIPDVGPSCELLLADQLFHTLDDDEREGLRAWIRSQQHRDGSWRGSEGGPDLSLTCLAYWALVSGGDAAHGAELRAALRQIHALGGARRANLSVRLWLAMAGLVGWDWVPTVPGALFMLPEHTPLSPMRLSPWARQMVTALHLLASGPARLHLAEVPELLLRNRAGEPIPPRLTRPGLAGDLLQSFDRSVELVRTLALERTRARAQARAQRWIETSQQAHGGWFSTRPTIYSLLALRVSGVASDDPRIERGLAYLRAARGVVELPSGARVLAQGTGVAPLAVAAKLGAIAGPEPKTMAPGVHARLLAAEIARPGPWQHRADAPTGAWPEVAAGEAHLDLRTSCAVLSALRGTRTPATRASLRRAAEVVLAMQEADGGFARFERGEARVPLARLPWRDADALAHGTPDDEARVVLSAELLDELGVLGWRREDDRITRALTWLAARYQDHGHAWSVSTLAALVRATARQCPSDDPLRVECERRLRTRQREDGSFGDELSTARALLALIACGAPCVQADRAARDLVARVGLLARTTTAGVLPSLPDRRIPAYGLSPWLADPSAGVTEIYRALAAFRREVGELASEAHDRHAPA